MIVRRTKWYRMGKAAAELVVAFLVVCLVAFRGAILRVLSVLATGVVWFAARARPSDGASHRSKSVSVSALTDEEKWKPVGPREVPTVMLESIAGLEEAKTEILLRTVMPLSHPDKARAYNLQTGGGVLLFGPQGCGKTMLGRGVASQVNAAFFHVRASDLICQWIGQSERNLAELFRTVRARQRALLFIDEVDAICPSRRRNRSTVMRRVISEFLSQLDGLESGLVRRLGEGFILVMGATNWPEMLDEAVLRPGRFDARVFVGLPDARARRQILEQSFADLPREDDISLDDIVAQSNGYSGADLVALVRTAAQKAFLDSIARKTRFQPVRSIDITAAFTHVRPSVSAAELERYLVFDRHS